jgi:hypothetical protein
VGPIQTYYWLAVASVVWVGFWLFMVALAAAHLRRWWRLGTDRLLHLIVTGAVVVMFIFITVGGIGILVGMLLSGSSQA